MIYKIIPQEDALLEKIYKESMDSLNDFYEINWVHHLPKVVVIDDRKTIDLIKGEKTENWITGWAEKKTVYVLSRDNFEKESSHKYDSEKYSALIKHELSHLFYNILSGHCRAPVWLSEGFAIYTSGQNKFKKKPVEFGKFLEFYNDGGSGVYSESGFFVQAIVEKFGKQKLFNMVKNLKGLDTKEKFEQSFAKEYGFQLTYGEINDKKLI